VIFWLPAFGTACAFLPVVAGTTGE
jgi:hypothetical protein